MKTPNWIKQTSRYIGALLILIGTPVFCGSSFGIFAGDIYTTSFGVFMWVSTLLTIGAGYILFKEGNKALKKIASSPLSFPSNRKLIGWFIFLIIINLFLFDTTLGNLIFPPSIIIVPPLMAVAWFGERQMDKITWRKGIIAFIGGAMLGAMLLIASVIIWVMVVLLISSSNETVFMITFIAFIILICEVLKPLVIVPILSTLSPRNTFLLGAITGVGFATLESVVYVGVGISYGMERNFSIKIWAIILILLAIGGAVHPLTTGLMTLAWRDGLKFTRQGMKHAMYRLGMAFGLQTLWKGAFLGVIMGIAPSYFYDNQSVFSAVLTVGALGFLIVIGMGAFLVGRAAMDNIKSDESATTPDSFDTSYTNLKTPDFSEDMASLNNYFNPFRLTSFELSDRAIAVWAVAWCFIVVFVGVILS